MQVLEWLVEHGDRVDAAVTIAAPARQTSWGRSLNHVQRRALDLHGYLELARMIAMLSYRYWDNLEHRFGSDTFETEPTETHPAEAWLDHHGQALRQRFDPVSYRRLMSAMDGHDVGRGRGGWRQALEQANAPVQVIGIVSDLLYPPGEQERLARALPQARLDWLNSRHGHDAFLIDQAALNQRVVQFRKGLRGARPTTLQACS
jgi:homoserine O-acetyltransferase/O-succinyltransferase